MNLSTLIEEGDLNRPSREIASDLIFIANGFRFPIDEVHFGIPQMLDQRPDLNEDANSFIPADVAYEVDDRFPGTTGFLYTRIDINALVQEAETLVAPQQYPFRVHHLLPQLRLFFNTQWDETDIEDEVVVLPVSELIIRCKPGSLAWIGSRRINVGPATSIPNAGRILTNGIARRTDTDAYRVVPTYYV